MTDDWIFDPEKTILSLHFLLSFTSYSDSPFTVLRISCWYLYLSVCFPFVPSDYFLLLPVEEDTHHFMLFKQKIYIKKVLCMSIFENICVFILLFIYLFMAVLGLRFCVRAFSSCGEWGPLFIAVRGPLHCRGLSCCGAQAPGAQAQ